MEFTRANDRTSTVLHAAGALSHQLGPGYSPEPLGHLCGTEIVRQTVLMDLGGICRVDGSGLAWLLDCAARFKIAGGHLILFGVPPEVLRPLRLIGFDAQLDIVSDLSAAKTFAQQVRK